MQIKISNETAEQLKMYCELTGSDMDTVVEESIMRTAAPYMPMVGYPKRGTVKMYDGSESPCVVLGIKTMLQNVYYRIVVEGKIKTVPMREVRIPRTAED